MYRVYLSVEVAQVQSLTETHLSASSLKMEWPWVKGTDEIVYRVNFSHSSIGYSDMVNTYLYIYYYLVRCELDYCHENSCSLPVPP